MSTFKIKSKNNDYLFKLGDNYLLTEVEHILQGSNSKIDHLLKESQYNDQLIRDHVKSLYPKSMSVYRKNRYYNNFFKDQIEKFVANINQVTFEVTDACNLKCKYCAYGEFYEGYDERKKEFLPFDKAKVLLDYLSEYWKSPLNSSFKRPVYISFYGGEPLKNINFIKGVVDYIKKMNIETVSFVFSMTTNGLLLNKYCDYLVKNDFELLVSLDGNKENNGYRVTPNGKSSFDTVFNNLILIKEQYPDYYEKRISYNTVLHNLNSVEDSQIFIYKNLGKTSSISELNLVGVRDDQKAEFNKIFKGYAKSFNETNTLNAITEGLKLISPKTNYLSNFLKFYSGNFFGNYNSLLYEPKHRKRMSTGTCSPFSKKMFVTVTGKILACERIGHQYSLGKIENDRMDLDFEEVAQKYNEWFEKLTKLCKACFNSDSCPKCMFYVDNVMEKPVCSDFLNKKGFEKYVGECISIMEDSPELYIEIMNREHFNS
jgi:uncharacterized protein